MGDARLRQGTARRRGRGDLDQLRDGGGDQAPLRRRHPAVGCGGPPTRRRRPWSRPLVLPAGRPRHDLLAPAWAPRPPPDVAVAAGRRSGALARATALPRALRRLGTAWTRLEPGPRTGRPRGHRPARPVGRPTSALLPPPLPPRRGTGAAGPVPRTAYQRTDALARAPLGPAFRAAGGGVPRGARMARHESWALGTVRRVGARRRHPHPAHARRRRVGRGPLRAAGLLQIRLPDRGPPQTPPHPERKRPLVGPRHRCRRDPDHRGRAHRGLPRGEHPPSDRRRSAHHRNPRRGLRHDLDGEDPRGQHRPRPPQPRDRGRAQPPRVLALALAGVLRDQRVQPGGHDRARRRDPGAAGTARLRPHP